MLVVHCGLVVIYDLTARLGWALLLLSAGFAALAWAYRRLPRLRSPAATILVVAGVLRVLLLPLPPSLSDDLLRYVWDGRVTTAGHNPYLLAPEDDELAPLRDEQWRRMPHKEIPTVYPPLALGFFSIAALAPSPMVLLKALLAAADLGTCGWLLVLARRRGWPVARVALYAWNPLVTLEVAGMGHVDALAVALAVTAVGLLAGAPDVEDGGAGGRAGRAGLAAAGGVLAKLGPLAALPLWSRAGGRPWRFLTVAGLALLVVGAPVLWAVGGVPPGLVEYGTSWEFNGPLYEPLWRALDTLGVAPAAKGWLDAWKEATEQWTEWNWLYPYLYPQLLAKLLLALVAVGVVARSWAVDGGRIAAHGGAAGEDGARLLVSGTGRLFGGLVLVSATFYPWYLLWVLPWAALTAHPAWLTLSATLLLSYLPQHTGLELWPWIFLLIWLPFWGLLAGHRRRGRGPGENQDHERDREERDREERDLDERASG